MKTIKRVFVSSVSILGFSFLMWTLFLLNPQLSYADHTQFDQVTVYHNHELDEGTELIINNAISIIKNSDIFDNDLNIQLCLNDDKYYPKLHPFAGATAYAFLNKTVIYASTPNFKNNVAEFKWEVNNYELRKYNLTALLAHEFMHNLQSNHNSKYYITSTLGSLNWRLEGHAEYIAREYKNDGHLKDKISTYLSEENKGHVGVPVVMLTDGTIQNLAYFKYALLIQYMIEIKKLDFDQICAIDHTWDKLYMEMLEWYQK